MQRYNNFLIFAITIYWYFRKKQPKDLQISNLFRNFVGFLRKITNNNMEKQFKLWNVIVGWLVFAVAAATYLLTIEPTASFWDCGEFISSADKLDVGHPPGAPFFMLMGHFFSLFASDASHVAMCVNALSALASAFTILFLFWTITALAKKLVAPDSIAHIIALLGAGAVGALAYTFSDTFWF